MEQSPDRSARNPLFTGSSRPALAWMLAFGLVLPLPALADDKQEAAIEAPAPVTAKLPDAPKAASMEAPRNAIDLLAIQQHVSQLVKSVTPCVVGVLVAGGSGSGVIISADGYVLTAGHVSGDPGRRVTLVLHNGKRVRGKTLGYNEVLDSGLIKINGDKTWPFVEMGDSGSLKPGTWCVAVGHPNGYKNGRPPVIRFGRVLGLSRGVVWTDCTLVSGDSGGPLFGLDGKVIGIHSRISIPTSINFHVPVDTYRRTWERLAAGERWGGRPYLGVRIDDDEKGARILEVVSKTPASQAGLKAGDVITKFKDRVVEGRDQLLGVIRRSSPGEKVVIELLRGGKPMSLRVTIGKQPTG